MVEFPIAPSARCAALALVLAVPFGSTPSRAGSASDPTAPTSLEVLALPDGYAVAGLRIDHLDVLASMLAEAGPSLLGVTGCGPEAYRSLFALAHRFRDVPTRLSFVPADAPGCVEAASGPVPAARVAAQSIGTHGRVPGTTMPPRSPIVVLP